MRLQKYKKMLNINRNIKKLKKMLHVKKKAVLLHPKSTMHP